MKEKSKIVTHHYKGSGSAFLEGTRFTVLILCFVAFSVSIYSQSSKGEQTKNTTVKANSTLKKKISGKVTDTFNLPLPGVNIMVKGTSIGTITDVNGNFELHIPEDAKIIVFTSVGLQKEEVSADKSIYNIVLKDNAVSINEVVVVGYGTQKKVSVTGAISSVDTKEMIKSPTTSVQNALAGRSPGLTIIQKSGAPGQDFADIYIRGKATYGNSSPLILVDGIERDITTIDPNEIESINILKDASATAVYGVRGANGVIVVTTKVGSISNVPIVTISANYGITNPTRIPRSLNSGEYARMTNAAALNDVRTSDFPNGPAGYANVFSDADIALYENGKDPIFHPNTDWNALLIKKNTPQQNYNVNISGGTNKVKYFVSLGYLSQQGNFGGLQVFKDLPSNGNVNRYNIRSNTDFQWTKNFTTSLKISTQITDGRNADWVAGTSNVLHAIWATTPISSIPLYDGKIIAATPELKNYSNVVNPLDLYNVSYTKNYISRTTVDLSTEYKLDAITKGLSVRGKFAYDNYYAQNATFSRQNDMYEIRRTASGYTGDYYSLVQTSFETPFTSSETYASNYRLYSEASLNYTRSFNSIHNVSALLLGTAERSYKGGNPALPYNYLGLVGRVTYDFKRKYLFELNIGYNGSENFAVGHQFGFFPAYSLGYVISEEKFFPKNFVISFLKIRGSEGKVGNDKVGTGRFLYTPSSFNSVTPTLYGLRFGDTNVLPTALYTEAKIGNPDISWEVATKSNIGFDMKMFDDRLTITADLFKERRDGILGNYNNVPYTFGDLTTLPSYNLGIVENGGYEIEIGYRSSNHKAFQYWVNGNYSFARNKIVYSDEIVPAYPNLVRTGLPINQPFMLVADGFYNSWAEVNDPKRIKTIWDHNVQPGDLKFKDINGDGIIDNNDVTAVGYGSVPEIVYGMNLGLSFKNFDFSVLIQGTGHVSNYYSVPIAFIQSWGPRTEADLYAWTADKYAAGDAILYPRLSNGAPTANSQINSYLNLDASYVRLKNIELGYALDTKLLKKFGCESMRIFVNGQNVALLSKMKYWDPESVSSSDRQYPVNVVWNIGVKANF
jgi:TonB-linked SusC/RagA family outer membrane protein